MKYSIPSRISRQRMASEITAQVEALSLAQSQPDIEYVDYTDESMLPAIQRLIAADLSEPYSIFTYRYFLHQWPNLCICVFLKDGEGNRGAMIGTIVGKAEDTRDGYQGYIAMLTVEKQYRKLGIGRKVK